MDDLTKAEKFKKASSKENKLIFLNQAHRILIAQVGIFLMAADLGVYFSAIFPPSVPPSLSPSLSPYLPSSLFPSLFILTTVFLPQMLTFGETIEFPLSNTDYASPLQPLKNIYLPHVMLLAKIKLRIGKNT